MSTTGYAFNVFVDSATSDSGVPKTQQPAIFPSGVDWKQAYRWEWNIADSGSPNSWFAVGNRLLTVPSAIPGGTKGNLPGNILSLTLLDINTQGSGPDFLEVSQLAVWVVVVHVSINGNHTSNLFNAAVTTDGFTQTGVVTVPNLTFANNVTTGTITVTVDATNAPLTTSDLRVLPQYNAFSSPVVQGCAAWGMVLTFAEQLPASATCSVAMWAKLLVPSGAASTPVYCYKDPEMDMNNSVSMATA